MASASGDCRAHAVNWRDRYRDLVAASACTGTHEECVAAVRKGRRAVEALDLPSRGDVVLEARLMQGDKWGAAFRRGGPPINDPIAWRSRYGDTPLAAVLAAMEEEVDRG